MITPDILAFIRKSRLDGMSPADIEASLKANGWQQQDIAEAYNILAKDIAPQQITPAPSMPVQTMNPAALSMNGNHPRHNTLRTSIISLVALLVVGGVAYGAYFAFTTYVVQNPLQKISDAILNLKNVTSFSSTVKISTSYSDPKSYSYNANVTVNNQAQGLTSTSTTQSQGDVVFSLQGSSASTNFMQAATYNIETDIAYRYINNVIYAELVKAPTISPMIDSYLNLKKFEGQWIQIPIQDGLNASKSTFGIKPDSLTKDEYAAIYEKYKSTPPFVIKTQNGADLNGKVMYHYTFIFNASNTISFEKDIMIATLQKTGSSKSQIDQATAQLNKGAAALDTMTGEIWIGKSDNMIHKFALDFDAKSVASLSASAPVHIEIAINDYNKTTTIAAPENSKTLQELYMSMNPGAAVASTNAGNARVTADISSIRTVAELIWSKSQSYASLCKNGTINTSAYKDLPGITNNILSSLGASSQSQAGITCVSTKDKYALQVKFPIKPGTTQSHNLFCVDSAGHAGYDPQYSINKATLSCK